jgi:glycosyltransferase involved in cell wall biosynthesis
MSATTGRREGGFTFGDVAVVVPTAGDPDAVETVLADVAAATGGKAEVVCVGTAGAALSDGTAAERAREAGARVIDRPAGGEGRALARAVEAVDRPVVVTADCDDSYPLTALGRFLSAVNDGADLVGGDRLAGGLDARSRRLRARACSRLASVLSGRSIRDVTSRMRAYRRRLLTDIEWGAGDPAVELPVRALARDYDVREVPIAYREHARTRRRRPGEAALTVVRAGVAEWFR